MRHSGARAKSASPESIVTEGEVSERPNEIRTTVDMDSGLLAKPVIGPATSGRTRWLGPGMTTFSSDGVERLLFHRSDQAVEHLVDRPPARQLLHVVEPTFDVRIG